MRFPSLFRTPRHQQFHIKPRYYDPVKEEIEERVARIRQEVEGEMPDSSYRSSISFKRKTKRTQSASFLQLVIAVLLGGMIFGWLEIGNDIFYYLLLVGAPLYLFFRLKSRKR